MVWLGLGTKTTNGKPNSGLLRQSLTFSWKDSLSPLRRTSNLNTSWLLHCALANIRRPSAEKLAPTARPDSESCLQICLINSSICSRKVLERLFVFRRRVSRWSRSSRCRSYLEQDWTPPLIVTCSIASSVIEGESVPTKQRKIRRGEVVPKLEYPAGTTIRKVLVFTSTADHSVYTPAARVSEPENCGVTFLRLQMWASLWACEGVTKSFRENYPGVESRDHAECWCSGVWTLLPMMTLMYIGLIPAGV